MAKTSRETGSRIRPSRDTPSPRFHILVTHDNSCAAGSSYPQSGYAPAAVTEDPGSNPTLGTYRAAFVSSYGPDR